MGGGRRSGPVGSLTLVAGWLAALWAAWVVEMALHAMRIANLPAVLGVRPREPAGLWGVLGAHVLHANYQHILSNTIGLGILGLVCVLYSRRLTAWAILYAMIGAGLMAWTFGAPGTVHIGASGVLFGLIGFLLANGIIRRDWRAILFAVVVLVVFGSALYGMFPQDGPVPISWQMHLGGFFGGVASSWHRRADRR